MSHVPNVSRLPWMPPILKASSRKTKSSSMQSTKSSTPPKNQSQLETAPPMIPSVNEYLFLCRDSEGLNLTELYRAGDACYEEGWIDEFGIITPKGRKAITEYEKETYK